MNLTQVNLLWDEYKKKYGIDDKIEIASVAYDTDEYVEGCFNLLELMDGQYILHLNERIHIYNEDYVKFILFHEFTHFYDFIHCPFEEREPLFMWMNAYSEYHACRVTLARFIETLHVKTIYLDKIQIPGPYRQISLRTLLEECLYRARYHYRMFGIVYQLPEFANGFRQLMYLFGYLSLFEKDEAMADGVLRILELKKEPYQKLYQALKKLDFDEVLAQYRLISNEAILTYIKAALRSFYDKSILSDEELDRITMDNYEDYIEILDKRKEEQEQREAAKNGTADGRQASPDPLRQQAAFAQAALETRRSGATALLPQIETDILRYYTHG